MVIGTPDNSYEDEMHHALGIPMVADLSQTTSETSSQKREPLRLTVTPHIDETQPALTGSEEPRLEEPKDVHIVRHGETTENADNTVRGWEPVSLNEKGIEEAHKAGKELKEKGVDTIVSSDLQRAKETADILKEETGAKVQFDPRLRTWHVGEHAGKPCETSNPVLKKYAQINRDKPVPAA